MTCIEGIRQVSGLQGLIIEGEILADSEHLLLLHTGDPREHKGRYGGVGINNLLKL